jgi:ATP-dependent DNA helicase RecQ
LINDIKVKGTNTDRVLVYCQTVKQSTQLYQSFSNELQNSIYADVSLDPRKRLVELLHSKTPATVKDNIINSFSKTDGCVRVLFATIAFGMGINAKGVRSVIHVGPSRNLEAYVREW